jgi:hypothetical protein
VPNILNNMSSAVAGSNASQYTSSYNATLTGSYADTGIALGTVGTFALGRPIFLEIVPSPSNATLLSSLRLVAGASGVSADFVISRNNVDLPGTITIGHNVGYNPGAAHINYPVSILSFIDQSPIAGLVTYRLRGRCTVGSAFLDNVALLAYQRSL